VSDWRDPTQAERETVEAAIRELANGHAEIGDYRVRSWASITFAGSKHHMTVRFRGPEAVAAGETFVAFLPEHEFCILGHLVADAAITSVSGDPGKYLGVSVEMLLIEDDA
jgi:hypothetical protein